MRYINPKAIPAPNMPGWYLHPDFPNYAISEDGQIWSYYKKRFLKPFLNKEKYLNIDFREGDKRRTFRIHRLVGWIFVKLPEEFNGNYDIATINHIDHNKSNNHYTNLAWVTASYNSQEAWDNGYCDHKKTPCFYINIKDKTITYYSSFKEADRIFDFTEGTISKAVNKQNGLLYGGYIFGRVDDPEWQERLANNTIEGIIDSYYDKILNYISTKPRPCFVIDVEKKKRFNFPNTAEADKHFSFVKGAVQQGITQQDGLLYGKYIVGYLDDPESQDNLASFSIDLLIKLYFNRINNHKSTSPKLCFCIDAKNKTCQTFNSTRKADACLGFPEGTVKRGIISHNELLYGNYIVGYLDDQKFKDGLGESAINAIIESYSDKIASYKPVDRGPKKITNLKTGESKIYKSLAEFARDNGFDPSNASYHLRKHADLYKVESV